MQYLKKYIYLFFMLCFSTLALPMLCKAETKVSFDGASIRTENPQGLRFKITVTDAKNALACGMYLTYNGKTLEVSTKDTEYQKIYSVSTDGNTVEYTVVVYGIPQKAFNVGFTVEGFAVYHTESGNEEQHTAIATRSVQSVADTAGYEYKEGNWSRKLKQEIVLSQDNLMVTKGVRDVIYNTDGSIDVKVNGAWGKVCFYLDSSKSAVDLGQYSKVVVNMSGDSQFVVCTNMTKTSDIWGETISPMYKNVGTSSTTISYDLASHMDESAYSIIVQYNSDTAPAEDFTMHIDSITLVRDVRDITEATTQFNPLYEVAEKFGFKN